MRAAALQYVRKVSGTREPGKANRERFERAVEAVTRVTRELLSELVVHAPPRRREDEIQKARARAAKRFGRSGGGAVA
jgi:hypothetical protein